MSRAFVKESDGTELDDLPELVVSPHRNLVTAEGLGLIETTLERLEAELTAARTAADRESVARAERDRALAGCAVRRTRRHCAMPGGLT